jgi:F-type H+-transporting ATPase subunit delta
MKAEGVAGRYAGALYDLAKEQGKVDAVLADIGKIEGMLGESADLRRLVESPVISADQQSKAVAAVLSKAGIAGLSSNFVQLLIRNRRLFALPDMMRAFRVFVARDRNEAVADVTSAHPLSQQQVVELSEALRASTGKTVKINAKVDPAILGGLVVKVGSRMVDSSLRTKLNALKVAMKGTA